MAKRKGHKAGELKPCPFCGSSYVEVAGMHNVVWVVCNECGARGPDASNNLKAAKRWNHKFGGL